MLAANVGNPSRDSGRQHHRDCGERYHRLFPGQNGVYASVLLKKLTSIALQKRVRILLVLVLGIGTSIQTKTRKTDAII